MAKKQPGAIATTYHRAKRGVLHVFVPHKGNSYHPHLLRPALFVLAISFAIGLYGLGMPTQGAVKGATTVGITEQTLLGESNSVRSKNNVPALALSQDLSKAAGLKAQDMLARQYWAHNAPDGTTPWYWFREVDYRYIYAGENLARGFETPQGVVTAWMNSPDHRENALNTRYKDVGFGVANGVLEGTKTTIVVALYGTLAQSSPTVGGEVLAAEDGNVSPLTQFGIGIQSMNPTMVGGMAVLVLITVVALGAYSLRSKVPSEVRKKWHHHHALYKAIFTLCLIIVLITLYGSGQIL